MDAAFTEDVEADIGATAMDTDGTECPDAEITAEGDLCCESMEWMARATSCSSTCKARASNEILQHGSYLGLGLGLTAPGFSTQSRQSASIAAGGDEDNEDQEEDVSH